MRNNESPGFAFDGTPVSGKVTVRQRPSNSLFSHFGDSPAGMVPALSTGGISVGGLLKPGLPRQAHLLPDIFGRLHARLFGSSTACGRKAESRVEVDPDPVEMRQRPHELPARRAFPASRATSVGWPACRAPLRRPAQSVRKRSQNQVGSMT